MISIFVDSNVLIDLVHPETSAFADWAAQKILEFSDFAPFVLNVLVAAELAFKFENAEALDHALPESVWRREPVPFAAAFVAGSAHRLYRQRGGQRERTLPDLLIGAHAMVAGHRLLTRDPARYRSYFPELDIVAPETRR